MEPIQSFFGMDYIWLFVSGLFFLFCSLWLNNGKNERLFLFSIFTCALLIRLFMAFQDPFPNDWDERYHMMVARNMMDEPFKPILHKVPMIQSAIWQWTLHHVWLHKQPLFLWQMALSMKVFGVSVFAARVPSAILGAAMVPILYRITTIITQNRKTALIAAVVFCFSGFQLEQISGYMGMDHNDVAFAFYVLASIWAYAEYTEKPRTIYIVLIGVFSGCAILNKWLTGLLVYAGWGINILPEIRHGRAKKELLNMLLALMATVIVFLPWQVYIHHTFPELAKFEMDFNAAHISQVIEGHGGSIFYYVDNFPSYFGEVGWFLVPAGFVVLLLQVRKRYTANKKTAIAILTTFAVVFIFFSYIVMSKLPSYLFLVAPQAAIFVAVACVELERQLVMGKMRKVAMVLVPCLVVAIAISSFNPADRQYNHNPNYEARQNKIANMAVYRNLKQLIPPDVKVVINAKEDEYIIAMFYNKGISVFNRVPEKYIMDSLIATNTRVAAFEARQGYELPDSLMGRPVTFVIKKQLK